MCGTTPVGTDLSSILVFGAAHETFSNSPTDYVSCAVSIGVYHVESVQHDRHHNHPYICESHCMWPTVYDALDNIVIAVRISVDNFSVAVPDAVPMSSVWNTVWTSCSKAIESNRPGGPETYKQCVPHGTASLRHLRGCIRNRSQNFSVVHVGLIEKN